MNCIVRKPVDDDYPLISHLLERSFAPSVSEAELVRSLKRRGKISFDFVAEDRGHIAAYVCYSAAYDSGRGMIGYHLAPLAVLPEKQRQGIGLQLMRESLALIGKQLPVYVLGDPEYYARFGFRADKTQTCSFDPEGRSFLVLFESPLPPREVFYEQEFMEFA